MNFLSTDEGWLNPNAIVRIADAIVSESGTHWWHKVFYILDDKTCEAWALAEDVEQFFRTENNENV